MSIFFFFNDTATTEIYTLSLHDALPICRQDYDERLEKALALFPKLTSYMKSKVSNLSGGERSEEHTSELQSRLHLVCRLLLEKKKNIQIHPIIRQINHKQQTRLLQD